MSNGNAHKMFSFILFFIGLAAILVGLFVIMQVAKL